MGQYIMLIPEHITPIWGLLYDETVWVHAYWKLYKQFFGGPQKDLDLMTRSAGFTFVVIQDALATDVQLTLSKLSDPAGKNDKTNATTGHLLNEIRALHWPVPVDELECVWQVFTDACAPIRKARNEMLAHMDRAVALGSGQVIPPVAATVGDVNEALQALGEFMNEVAAYIGESPTVFQSFIMRGEGGDDLISLLRMAERYQTLLMEGKIPWDDLPNG